MNRGLFFFLLIYLLTNFAFATSLDPLDPSWLKLVHYHKTLGGNFESESLPSKFFLSAEGRHQPQQELEATVAAMLKPIDQLEDSDTHALCQFPARAIYLAKHVPEIRAQQKLIQCEDFSRFQNRLQAKSLSLVFSSYYLNTPASAFGHTLMRFIKNPEAKESERFELLDYAANYAAIVTTQNSFLYGVLGMTGGFRGEFASLPYFYKIREYNDFESRDIWDYELNLSASELEMVIAHLWETRLVQFPYYYLTKNCSYHMLALLDVANPEWKLTDRMPKIVIPVDTIKVIKETPGLLKKVSFRPSKKRTLDHRIDQLSRQEASLVKKAVKKNDPSLLTIQNNSRQHLLLDAAIDSIDFLHAEKILLEDPQTMEWKRKFLIARSKIDQPSKEIDIQTPENERPDLGHGSRRISVARGNNKKHGAYTTIEYRAALHDLLDPSLGQNPGASMEMGRIRLRYNNKMKSRSNRSWLWLDDLSLIEVQSISPMTTFYKNLSWKIYVGAQTLQDSGCFGCLAPQITGAGGYSIGLIQKMFVSFFVHAGVEQNNDLSPSSFRLTGGPEAQLIWKTKSLLNVSLFGKMSYYAISKNVRDDGYWGARGKQEIFQDFTLNLEYLSRETGREASVGISYYY